MRKLFTTALLLAVISGWTPARAAVVVVANRTPDEVRFTLACPPGQAKHYAVDSGDLVAVPVTGDAEITYSSGKKRQGFRVDPNAVYYFAGRSAEELNLHEVDFSGSRDKRPADKPAPRREPPPADSKAAATVTIPVKILVDQGERTVQRAWEQRLRKRVQAASDILEHHCRVKLEVVAAGTWESDDSHTELAQLLHDFEEKVKPGRARLAIGFSSQKPVQRGPDHLGATQLPLHTHIIVREAGVRSEPERLEVLLHELGHFLGAAHSSEPTSVMRPKLGDRKALARRFRIGFDPVNTLVMNLVADGLRSHGAKSLLGLSPAAKQRLGQVYAEIERAMPEDPTPGKYLAQLGQVGQPGEAAVPVIPELPRSEALVENTRAIVAAVVQAAERNQRRPARTDADAKAPFRLGGDELTDYYFREAAAVAERLAREHAVRAYLLGLAVALDDSSFLRKSPVTAELWSAVEPDEERKHRLEVLGAPAMRGHRDWAQHFTVSAALTLLWGAKSAEAAGLLKEVLDARGDGGFSFTDLSADLSGVAFANRLRSSPDLLGDLTATFTVTDYLPDAAGLRDGLSAEDFAKDYGSLQDDRFLAQQEAIRKRILALPGHQAGKGKGG
jgi:hypothetical protein